MFVCKKCADKHMVWGIFESLGPCEVCGNSGICFEVPAANLWRDFSVIRGGGKAEETEETLSSVSSQDQFIRSEGEEETS